MPAKIWKIGITGLVILLVIEVAGLHLRVNGLKLEAVKAEVDVLKDEVGKLQAWEQIKLESEVGNDSKKVEVDGEKTAPVKTVAGGQGVREIYIPLGSGSTSSQDWVNTGAQSYIDTNTYRIRSVYFEGSLRANSGQVWAR